MLVTILLILTCAFGVFFGIFHFFGNRELYNKTKHIKGPFSVPIIGSAFYFIGDSAHLIKQTLRLANTYTSPFRVVLGSRVFVITKDPEQIKTILQSPNTAEKDNIYDFAKSWVGNGLITSEHKIWRIHRKIIQPTFSQKCLQSFVSIFANNAILMAQSVDDRVGGPEFEIFPYIAYNSISNICESSMGVSVKSQKEDVNKFHLVSERAVVCIINRLIRVWLHSDFLFQFSQIYRNFNNYVKYLHTFTDKVIQKRREIFKQGPAGNVDGVDRKRKPTLDLLLELSDSESQLNDKELRDHILTIILAGYDTIARTMDFVFLMLAQQPKVQDKVYEEIFNIYGTDDPEINPVKYEDLHHFQYLERVIKETMRLFPVGPWLARQVSEDILLGDSTVPKGCSAVMLILALHRDEKIWNDPLKFDPDRFLPENVNKRHPCAFIPFSFGTRDCIGRMYSMMSMKVQVVTFLRKYVIKKNKFTEPGDIKLKVGITLDTVEPLTLQIEKRVN